MRYDLVVGARSEVDACAYRLEREDDLRRVRDEHATPATAVRVGQFNPGVAGATGLEFVAYDARLQVLDELEGVRRAMVVIENQRAADLDQRDHLDRCRYPDGIGVQTA
jgi:hypothetical protein